MSREILFRGKRHDHEEWIYGSLCNLDGKRFFIRENKTRGQWVEIDPNTIGQYTGLTDNADNKIFEGDFLESVNSFSGDKFIDIVKFEDGCWQLFNVSDNKNYEGLYYIDIEDDHSIIIGNIHDNPELLNPPTNE